ncbi:MAG: hypothetical protein PUA50_03465 [Eubacteriales bacterium]|nr:hypothetical protein [Eubacteriales bacterium]
MISYRNNTTGGNGLPMTDDEIIRSWKNAACRKDQVDILSQLNDCSKKKIVKILFDGGVLPGQAVYQYRKAGLLPPEEGAGVNNSGMNMTDTEDAPKRETAPAEEEKDGDSRAALPREVEEILRSEMDKKICETESIERQIDIMTQDRNDLLSQIKEIEDFIKQFKNE